MLKRQRYREYRDNKRFIHCLESDPCMTADVVVGSSVEAPYTAHSVKIRGVDKARKAFNQHIIDGLKERCAEVEADIEKAPNIKMRLMLTLHYIDGLSWDDVGQMLETTGDACRQTIYRYFNPRS